MLVPIIVAIAILCLLLAASLIFASATNLLIMITLGVLLIGGIALVVAYSRHSERNLLALVRLYLQRVEQIYSDFSSHKSLDRQVSELAASLFNDFEFDAVAFFARKKQGFTLIESHGIKKEQLAAIRFSGREELILQMESRRSNVAINKIYPESAKHSPFVETPFVEAVPVLSSGKCSYFILVSESRVFALKLLRPFLLALADQVGNYRLLDDLNYKHNQSVTRLRKQLEGAQRERKEASAARSLDSRAMIAAQDRMVRLHNRDQLYTTLIHLMEEQFKVESAFVIAIDAETREYSFKYQLAAGELPKEKLNFTPESFVFSFLRSNNRIARLSSLPDKVKSEEGLSRLRDMNIKALALLPDINEAPCLLAIGRGKGDFASDELEGIYSFCRLFNLVLENLNHFENIEKMSYTDSMTGLYNYRYFYKRLHEEILRAKRFNRRLALVIFDIDEFKVFNDTYGHQSGDYLLEQLGNLLAKSVRSIDVVSRYGGEEFCVIMPETSSEDCNYFMDRMRLTIMSQEFKDRFSTSTHRITVSLGGAIYPNDAQRIDRLIYCADMALLQAKSTGRNKSLMFDENLITIKR